MYIRCSIHTGHFIQVILLSLISLCFFLHLEGDLLRQRRRNPTFHHFLIIKLDSYTILTLKHTLCLTEKYIILLIFPKCYQDCTVYLSSSQPLPELHHCKMIISSPDASPHCVVGRERVPPATHTSCTIGRQCVGSISSSLLSQPSEDLLSVAKVGRKE